MPTPASQPTQPKRGRGRTVAIIIIVLIIILAAGYYVLYGMGSSTSSTTNTSMTHIVIPNGTAASGGSLNFSPVSVTVIVGTSNTIVFTNNDVTEHTVTFTTVPTGAQASAISDSNLAPGSSFTVTLTVAGTYSYHCTIHSFMQGTIIVT
jgi:plastocyanin